MLILGKLKNWIEKDTGWNLYKKEERMQEIRPVSVPFFCIDMQLEVAY